jgi:2-(1,2-epoxy-1,2-dihydrophenyl)acetyl-CoA isomerase
MNTDMYKTLIIETTPEGVLVVTMNRPKVMNAADETMVSELKKVYTTTETDDKVRSILITGAGRAFCSGRDISSAAADEDAYDIIHNHVNPMLATIYHFSKPTIAAVNGAAMGVGLGIALACDIVIAADNAKMSSPFANLGVALDSGGHFFLPRRIGIHRALEMAYTSDIIRGKQAADWGLVNFSVAGARLMPRAHILATRIALGPINAFKGQKTLMRASETMNYDEVCEAEAKLQASLMGSAEYAEGLTAFNEKRRPNFRNI